MKPDAAPPETIKPAGVPYLRGAMRAYYRYVDRLIEPILKQSDAHTTIIVCSDHGFVGGAGKGVDAHKVDGVLIMAGNHIAKGEIMGASVYDMTPTILALLGLPPAEDMRGKVLWSAFDGSIPRDRYQHRIPTYETGEHREAKGPLKSPIDEELKARLRSLGYID